MRLFLGVWVYLARFLFMSTSASKLLTQVYSKTSPKAVFALHCTGGGVGALQLAFGTPGASSSLMEGSVPYSRSAMRTFLGNAAPFAVVDKDGFCEGTTAEAMARRSRQLATEHFLEDHGFAAAAEANIFGVACTASLASVAPKRGDHRAFVAVSTDRGTKRYSCVLDKDLRSRAEEDDFVTSIIMEAIADAAGVGSRCTVGGDWQVQKSGHLCGPGICPGDRVEVSVKERPPTVTDTLNDILQGRSSHALFLPRAGPQGGFACLDEAMLPEGSLVYPGSFNPLHMGHVQLALAARSAAASAATTAVARGSGSGSQQAHRSPAIVFEMSAMNADKAPLDAGELESRLAQFLPSSPLILEVGLEPGSYAVSVSNAPLFSTKSVLYPSCGFVMGADTFTRIIDRKYYSESTTEMAAALMEVQMRGAHIYVGGRVDEDGTFETMNGALQRAVQALPVKVRAMFTGLSEEEFRADISSTHLRAAAVAAAVTTQGSGLP
jgi:hypothetical protein